jgi:antitoxin (DNA-binding transcriptional repressor) of toxin-antitoxin stability system
MAIVHIPEAEARRDLEAVLARYDAGDEVIIERASGPVTLVEGVPRRPLTFAEAIQRMPKRPSGAIDQDFLHDAKSFRERHPEPFDASKWD